MAEWQGKQKPGHVSHISDQLHIAAKASWKPTPGGPCSHQLFRVVALFKFYIHKVY